MSDSDPASQPNGIAALEASPMEVPSTPQDHTGAPPPSSQVTLPSTEVPASPIDLDDSYKTDLNDGPNGSAVIPSSLTPPPSSQVPTHGVNGAYQQPAFQPSQRSNLVSPPPTTPSAFRRDGGLASDYAEPTNEQVLDASASELRAMLQDAFSENRRRKTEAAHHKLQYNMLVFQAEEDHQRALVEKQMLRTEIETLRRNEFRSQARYELDASPESPLGKYLDQKMRAEALEGKAAQLEATVEKMEIRHKKSKKTIRRLMREKNDIDHRALMLERRIVENRQHLERYFSPGGLLYHSIHAARQQVVASPQQTRGTPRQAPRSQHRETGPGDEQGDGQMAVLLQALSQDNNSAPSTPTAAHRPAPRHPSKHTRNVQSLSSLPTTPTSRRAPEHIPSLDRIPQTEPARRHADRRFVPGTPPRSGRLDYGRKSRESTISAEDNNETVSIARQAVAFAQNSTAGGGARASFRSHESARKHPSFREEDEDEADVQPSQASQAASDMLRRDPRQSFEVASSGGGSREASPPPHGPAEKSATLQAKLLPGFARAAEKRKFSAGLAEDARSPPKKMRVGPLMDQAVSRVGLGIQYSQ